MLSKISLLIENINIQKYHKILFLFKMQQQSFFIQIDYQLNILNINKSYYIKYFLKNLKETQNSSKIKSKIYVMCIIFLRNASFKVIIYIFYLLRCFLKIFAK